MTPLQYEKLIDHCIMINYFGCTEIHIKAVPLVKVKVSQFIFGEELNIVRDILDRERDHPFDSLGKILEYHKINFVDRLIITEEKSLDVILRICISRVYRLGLIRAEKLICQDFILNWSVLLRNIKEKSRYGEKPDKQYDLRNAFTRPIWDKPDDLPF